MSSEKYKVTFILDAGASSMNKRLPLVADYSIALNRCASKILSLGQEIDKDLTRTWAEDLRWLAKKGEEHNTVDSFAKWCSKNSPNDLIRIKNTLSVFFCVEQFVNGARDPRYNQFITELTDESFKFPDNISIINWNYDSQMQLACRMNTSSNLEQFAYRATGKNRHIKGIIHYYPTMSEEAITDETKFHMVHMNGIAGYVKNDFEKSHVSYQNINGEITDLKSYIKVFHEHQNSHPLFNFAFEKTDKGREIDDRVEIARKMVVNTDILVIIGYSFPPVNDDIDRDLISFMKKGHLKKIYIQSPGLSPDSFRTRFDIPDKTKIERVDQLDSFHIALEYKQIKPSNTIRATVITPSRTRSKNHW